MSSDTKCIPKGTKQPTTTTSHEQKSILRTQLGTVVYQNTASTTAVDAQGNQTTTNEVTFEVIPEGGDPLPLEDNTNEALAIAEAEKFDEQLEAKAAKGPESSSPATRQPRAKP